MILWSLPDKDILWFYNCTQVKIPRGWSRWMGKQVSKKNVELREFVSLEADYRCSTAGVSFEMWPVQPLCQRCKVMHSYQIGRWHQTGARSWCVEAGLLCREIGGMGQKYRAEEMYTRILGFFFFFFSFFLFLNFFYFNKKPLVDAFY